MVLHQAACLKMLLMYETNCPLRSSGLLVALKCRTKTSGEAAFSSRAPGHRSDLPEDLRGSESGDSFKVKLETCVLIYVGVQD